MPLLTHDLFPNIVLFFFGDAKAHFREVYIKEFPSRWKWEVAFQDSAQCNRKDFQEPIRVSRIQTMVEAGEIWQKMLDELFEVTYLIYWKIGANFRLLVTEFYLSSSCM